MNVSLFCFQLQIQGKHASMIERQACYSDVEIISLEWSKKEESKKDNRFAC